MFRIHSARLSPWWFSRSGAGRFDPIASEGLGSCYFAEQPEGCFLEVFRSFTTVVPRHELETRRICRIELPRAVRLADCTSESARSWGITAEIHSTPSYEATQRWAHALAQAGFDGIRYLLRHDPAQRLAGVVLFGPYLPGKPSQPISEPLIQEVRRRFGVQIVP